jgi:hypothetical protein
LNFEKNGAALHPPRDGSDSEEDGSPPRNRISGISSGRDIGPVQFFVSVPGSRIPGGLRLPTGAAIVIARETGFLVPLLLHGEVSFECAFLQFSPEPADYAELRFQRVISPVPPKRIRETPSQRFARPPGIPRREFPKGTRLRFRRSRGAP